MEATFFGMKDKLIRYRSHPTQMSGAIVLMSASTINVKLRYIACTQVSRREAYHNILVINRLLVRAQIESNDLGGALRNLPKLLRLDCYGWKGAAAAGKYALKLLIKGLFRRNVRLDPRRLRRQGGGKESVKQRIL
jgi:hypothetical protein